MKGSGDSGNSRVPCNGCLFGNGLNAFAHLFVSNVLATIQLSDALAHPLTEPRVVVNLLFDKLPDVFVCPATILGGNTTELGFQFLTKLHFHQLAGLVARAGGQRLLSRRFHKFAHVFLRRDGNAPAHSGESCP